MWYRVKAHYNGHNLSNETETLSRFVLGAICIASFGVGGSDPQNGGKGWGYRGSKMVPLESVISVSY